MGGSNCSQPNVEVVLENGVELTRLDRVNSQGKQVDIDTPREDEHHDSSYLSQSSSHQGDMDTSHSHVQSWDSNTALHERSEPESWASELPPIDKGKNAWTFLSAATVLELLIWGMGNASGAFQDYHLSSRESPLYGSPSSISAASSTLITAGQYFAPFCFLGYLSAFPHHVTKFSGVTLALSVLGLVGASIRPSPATVVALQGFLSGWAGGAFYTPAMLWLPQWFDSRRGLATGILFLGSGVGGVIWPFAISGLLNSVGFQWTLRCLALIQGVLGATVFFFMRPRMPVIRTARNQSGQSTGSRHRRNKFRSILPAHDRMMQSPLGIANAALQFCQGASFWSISYYLSPYATSLGLSTAKSTALLSTLNAASALSYVVTGRLCDVMPYTPLAIVLATAGSFIVALLLGFARTLPTLFAFSVIYGLVNGGFSTIMSPAAKELAVLGQTEHSAIFVEIMAMRGLGGVAGPLISSTLYKTGSQAGSWGDSVLYGSHGLGPVVIFSTVLSAIVALIALGSIPFRKYSSSL